MKEPDVEKFQELLRSAVGPISDELKQDLWPRMLQRLDERTMRASWLDWALIALLPVWLSLFPEVILVLLYHL